MLKAVRFDEEKHKDLLDYIEEYRDNKGKPNHSEAIRFLMEKGFESIVNPQVEQKVEIQPINVDSIKEEVYNGIMEELTKKFFSQMGVPATIIQQPIQQPIITEVKKDPPPKPKPSPPRVVPEGNGLLANLLGNANR